MTIDWRRLRPAELLALVAGVGLVVALFLPWYEIHGVRQDAWSALTVTEIPAALAALGALVLVAATVTQHSPALPLRVGVWTATLAVIAIAVTAARAAAPPAGATARCYGLWIALAAAVAVAVAAIASLRDERPFWGATVTP